MTFLWNYSGPKLLRVDQPSRLKLDGDDASHARMMRRVVARGRAVTARGPAMIRLYTPHYGVMPNRSA